MKFSTVYEVTGKIGVTLEWTPLYTEAEKAFARSTSAIMYKVTNGIKRAIRWKGGVIPFGY